MKKILIASPEELPPELASDPDLIVIPPEDVDEECMMALDAASGGLLFAEEQPGEGASEGEELEEPAGGGGREGETEEERKAREEGGGAEETEEERKAREEGGGEGDEEERPEPRPAPAGRGARGPARGGRGGPLATWAQHVAGRR